MRPRFVCLASLRIWALSSDRFRFALNISGSWILEKAIADRAVVDVLGWLIGGANPLMGWIAAMQMKMELMADFMVLFFFFIRM